MNGRLEPKHPALIKVSETTLLFWIIKILATTLGETAGDTVTMTMGAGYLFGVPRSSVPC